MAIDSLITAAAHALSTGDPLGALKRVALRDDPPALALRGIAMAQLGDFDQATILLRRAERTFGPREVVSRARCVVAKAEIALAARDLAWPVKALAAARITLEARGDRINAAHARSIEARRLLLIGQIDDAERVLGTFDPSPLPPALRAAYALAAAGIAMRRIHARSARAALERAAIEARRACIPALIAEVESAVRELNAPVARMITRGEPHMLLLGDVEMLFASLSFIVDTFRYAVRRTDTMIPLVTRPILFALVHALAEAWPTEVPRDALVARIFRLKHVDESARVRLRVEMGRLRKALRSIADVRATPCGFALSMRSTCKVVVLERLTEVKHATVLALLTDGESWSSSGLALALGTHQRSVQRALEALAARGQVQSFGRGCARRWMSPSMPGLAPTLLLPALLPRE